LHRYHSVLTPETNEAFPILVGVDLESPEPTISAGAGLARRTGASLELVHVIEPSSDRRDAHRRLAAATQSLEVGVTVVVLESDSVADGLLDRARRVGASILILGSRDGDGPALGEVARDAIRRAPADLLVARGHGSRHRRIAVATDFSALGDAAFEAAMELASHETRVDLIHCCALAALPIASALAPDISAFEEIATERGNQLLDRWRPRHRSLYFHALGKSPAAGLREWLEKEPCDLLVIGSHGRRGLDRVLQGSVAEEVAGAAPCSVLVVKTYDEPDQPADATIESRAER
jgi:nucleotide-binding universal stress UspA family protein